jgi:2-keto-4-pentenoate hydratase/2-oxohepta-3-ene-1,7-dioic acid hydratase in catechol pathway
MSALVLSVGAMVISLSAQGADGTHYVRFQHGSTTAFGIREGETIKELKGDLFQNPKPTGKTFKLADVKLLTPLDWEKVHKIIGIGINSGKLSNAPLKPVAHPYLFAKFPQGLRTDNSEIETLPEMFESGGPALIFEGEVVLVIGKTARFVSEADAMNYVFGITVGNDVSQFDWWFNGSHQRNMKGENVGTKMEGAIEGKALDSWAGVGTDIVSGLDLSNLHLKITKNGQVVSNGTTAQFLNPPANIVAYISHYLTLLPGDLIYMGCFCADRDMSAREQHLYNGDKIEFDLEHVGKLRQTVVPTKIPAQAAAAKP